MLSWLAALCLAVLAGCGGMDGDEGEPSGTAARLACRSLPAPPVYDIERIDAIPDYLQTSTIYGALPGGGAEYCSPAAVSNTLLWLSGNGYPKLANGSGDLGKDQFEMVRELGADYLRTDPAAGTMNYWLLYGVRNYLHDRGYRERELSFQGWLYHSSEFSSGLEIPSLDCLKGALAAGQAVWLHIGFYAHDPLLESYARIGAHMVTAVGFGFDGQYYGTPHLVVHDPAARAGLSFRNEYVFPVLLSAGTLTGPYHGLPRSAAGYHRLEGVVLPKGGDVAILDGVVLLALSPAKP